MTKTKSLPRRVGAEWRIECSGCVVFLRRDDTGGTVVDVCADGDRYGENMLAKVTVREPEGRAEGHMVYDGALSVRVNVTGRP